MSDVPHGIRDQPQRASACNPRVVASPPTPRSKQADTRDLSLRARAEPGVANIARDLNLADVTKGELQSVPDYRLLKHTIGSRWAVVSIGGGEGAAGTTRNEPGLFFRAYW